MNDPIVYKYETAIANFNIAQGLINQFFAEGNLAQVDFYQRNAEKYLQEIAYYGDLIQHMRNPPIEFEFGKRRTRITRRTRRTKK